MKCGVWSVKTLLRLSLKKKPLVEGRTRSGQVFLRTIGHLFLGNFRRRLARVLVIVIVVVVSVVVVVAVVVAVAVAVGVVVVVSI